MAKILLVEDDNNLREIYEARLVAEGYEIVSAKDGEEALVIAKKELPDLVIADIMMPRISGFEMLDIMRNTEGLADMKVIMLTALGQAEDKTRADQLGADRYLVKSQVTLEDIVKAASDLLGGEGAATVTNTATAVSTPQVSTVSAPDTVQPSTTPATPPQANPNPTPQAPAVSQPAAQPPQSGVNNNQAASQTAPDDSVATPSPASDPQSNQTDSTPATPPPDDSNVQTSQPQPVGSRPPAVDQQMPNSTPIDSTAAAGTPTPSNDPVLPTITMTPARDPLETAAATPQPSTETAPPSPTQASNTTELASAVNELINSTPSVSPPAAEPVVLTPPEPNNTPLPQLNGPQTEQPAASQDSQPQAPKPGLTEDQSVQNITTQPPQTPAPIQPDLPPRTTPTGAPIEPTAPEATAPQAPAAEPEQPAQLPPAPIQSQQIDQQSSPAAPQEPETKDSVTIAGKKVIRPLEGNDSFSQPGLADLLAKENAQQIEPMPAEQTNDVAPHPPGSVFTPNTGPSTNTPGSQQQSQSHAGDVDPNSVAL